MESVLHLGKFSNERVGGIETVIDSLLEGLSSNFQLVNLVANNSLQAKTIKQSGYVEHSVSLLGIFASTPLCPSMPYQIKKLHQRYCFSKVHLHFPNPMAHLASEILPRSVKRIISWHSDVIRQKQLLQIYQPFVNRLLKQATALIVSTPYLSEKSLQLSVARQRNIIHIIPYGVDFDYFSINKHQERIERIHRQFPDRFIVFALGRHVYYKGFCYLIDAMSQLPSDLILLLGGDGRLTQKLKRQVSVLKLEQQVYFLGQISKQDLPAYYHACDVFCLPSIDKNEAFGIVQLEAMACAKPIISCDLTNAASNINQDGLTGFVVSPRCPTLLADAIRRLYQEPLLCHALGRTAYQYAKEKFTTQRMVQQVKNLYEEIGA
ncbi:MAG: glycosyltransferase [Pseudomonadota bacterium]